MIFNSVTYIVFLLIVVPLFWILNLRLRLYLIFFSSILFYSFWRYDFVALMLFSAIIDYFMSINIYKTVNNAKRKIYLYISLSVNLGLLFIFKYLYFFTENLQGLLYQFNSTIQLPLFELILPLGISFYTFQTISYTVDVYRGFIKPEKDFITYACYVMFFPQLIAGPILRAGEVIHQLVRVQKFSFKFIADGIKRILYGLFLKTVLADNIAPLVDQGFTTSIQFLSAIDVWVLAFLFGFQIYFDFSAYSHIAIGSAKLLGINFPENFNFPYIATSFKDFWKRWHISLSSWIRDYLYLPLQGQKVINKSTGGIPSDIRQNKSNANIALFFTWSIMGLWHGANWTFVLWGIYHFSLIFIERKFDNFKKYFFFGRNKILGLMITLPLTMLSWIPFRANNISDAFMMWGKILHFDNYLFLGLRENIYLVTFFITILFFVSNLYFTSIRINIINRSNVAKNCLIILEYAILLFFVFIFLRPVTQFIYFQF